MLPTRESVFCSEEMPDLFHPIAHTNNVFRADPFDVREVHLEAREVFERLVSRAHDDKVQSGRILLLKGESGSGKTHLVRAFRNFVHGYNLALFGYMQMTTASERYDRYVLQKIIDSLDRPYAPPYRRATSLRILSDEVVRLLPSNRVEQLQSAESGPDAQELVDELTDQLIDQLDMPELDRNVLRAFLYLQCDRPNITNKVTKYLRMDAMSSYELRVLGDMPAQDLQDDALEMVTQIARIARRVLGRGLVVCVDQLEDIYNLDGAKARFGRVMDAVKQLGEIPGAVVVVACHSSFFTTMRDTVSSAVLARIEQDPTPIELNSQRSVEEASAIIQRRLYCLFDDANVAIDENQPTDPVTPNMIGRFERASTRQLLEDIRLFRELAQQTQQIPNRWPEGKEETIGHQPAVDSELLARIQQDWNDFSTQAHPVPEDDGELAQVLVHAIMSCGDEMGVAARFEVLHHVGTTFEVRHHGLTANSSDIVTQHLWVGLCDQPTRGRGGKLLQQLREFGAAAEGRRPVVVRSSEFPGARTKTTQELGVLIEAGGRRAVVQDSDWRCMVAMAQFRQRYGGREFLQFLREEKPLTSLESIREMLALDELRPVSAPKATVVPTPKGPSAVQVSSEKSKLAKAGARRMGLGRTLGRKAKPVELDTEDLKRHMAFLGSTGSGKTTAALLIIENLLARGIPVIMVDRKGDLSGYRRPGVWEASLGDEERDAFRKKLSEQVEVALYTPGNPSGRGLSISLLPRGLFAATSFEQEQAARTSAQALADMMRYGSGQKAQGKLSALQKALEYLAKEEKPVTVDDLIDFVREREPSYLAELGGLAKFVSDLETDLEIMVTGKRSIMGREEDDVLDAARLFGRGASEQEDGRNRTRLSIISTKFLPTKQDELFWVSQLLLEVHRWGKQNPADELQGIVLLDEADTYLPAVRQPPTKQPVEDLLRRARSMGIGMFLATQNPGDFDYRCRDNILTWLVGRLTQTRGIEKIEEMLTEAHSDASSLGQQTVGQFHLLAGGQVQRLEVTRNAVKLPSQLSDEEILELAAAGTVPALEL